MRAFLFLFFVIFGFCNLSAQERFLMPADEAKNDASFFVFRTKLIEAAKKRDAKYVLSILDRNITNNFGGDGGIEDFKDLWKIHRSDSEFWREFLLVITNGGKFNNEDNRKIFYAPYTFASFPDDLDSFTFSVIFGDKVNVRSSADAKSPVVGSLSYNIVEILKTIREENNAEKISWYKIKTLGGKTGFVKAEFARSPTDYRAGFEKKNGKWKMTAFIAGD